METNPAPPVDPKFILTSKSVVGVIVMLLPTILGWFGVHFDNASAETLGNNLLSIVGALIAIWGRFTARGPLTFRATPPGIPPELPAVAIFLAPVAIVIALYLSACSADGRLKLPTLNARVGYMTSDGQKISYDSASDSILVDGAITSTRRTGGGGKTFVEFSNR